MHILLKNHTAAESLIEQNRIRTQLYMRKVRISFLLGFGIALLLVSGELFISSGYSMVRMGKNTIYFKLHLLFSLGIGLALVLSYLLLKSFNIKRQLLKEVTHLASLFRQKNEFEIQITEQEVTLSSHVFYQKISWELFQSYSLYGDYLLLNMGNQPFYGISIDKRLLSEADFQTVQRFAAQKLNKA